MSKKDRLKAQKAKQDILKKEAEEQERLEAEEAKLKQSKAAKKMMKKAKRKGREPVFYLILKILMIVPFAYSGFFYGGVLVLGVFGKYITPQPPKWVGWCAAAGIVLILAGIIIAFLKKYLVSFIVTCVGTGVFLKAPQYMIGKIQNILENYTVDESYLDMDKQYMQYYYPIICTAVISLILLIFAVIRKIRDKKQAQHQKDTAPVESIVSED
ncbi:hypothetical protein [uncultured Ruminococcus sp.]|uniref:hypothetical protein n=1 Tax=uncultured Ruminococcus sp. TaxID=165186 RepID=UPI0025D1BD52|nr:hypothetical protein [uncultured Ruminococcus sp.]